MACADEVDTAIFVSLPKNALEFDSVRGADQARRKVINSVAISRHHQRLKPIVPNKTPRIMRRHAVAEKWLQPKLVRRKAPDSSLMQSHDPMRRFNIRIGMQPL